MDEPKFCVTCTHLIGVRGNPEYAAGWKCGAPGNRLVGEADLVTGLPKITFKLVSCGDVRHAEDACGPKGLWHTEYQRPVHPSAPKSGDALLQDLLK